MFILPLEFETNVRDRNEAKYAVYAVYQLNLLSMPQKKFFNCRVKLKNELKKSIVR